MSSEAASTLAAQLGEMDRMLQEVQADLVPEREPAPVLHDSAPAAAIPDPRVPEPPPLPPPVPEPPPPPEPVPPPIPEPPAPPPLRGPALDAGAQIVALTEFSERLIASMRELLDGYERVRALTS